MAKDYVTGRSDKTPGGDYETSLSLRLHPIECHLFNHRYEGVHSCVSAGLAIRTWRSPRSALERGRLGGVDGSLVGDRKMTRSRSTQFTKRSTRGSTGSIRPRRMDLGIR